MEEWVYYPIVTTIRSVTEKHRVDSGIRVFNIVALLKVI